MTLSFYIRKGSEIIVLGNKGLYLHIWRSLEPHKGYEY